MRSDNQENKHSPEGGAEHRHHHVRVTLVDNIVITFLITLAFSSITFETRYSGTFLTLYQGILLMSFLFTWVFISFRSGRHKKWGFLIYTLIFWLVPQLMILLYQSGPKAIRLSLTAYVMSEFSKLMTIAPAEFISKSLSLSPFAMVLLIVLFCCFTFVVGVFCTEKRNKAYKGAHFR